MSHYQQQQQHPPQPQPRPFYPGPGSQGHLAQQGQHAQSYPSNGAQQQQQYPQQQPPIKTPGTPYDNVRPGGGPAMVGNPPSRPGPGPLTSGARPHPPAFYYG
ncbi:hypothetical protein BGZ67_008020 [Mortierella alpina]|nr:hypothetical protein BGZ67_008020 [Mortierella alpina]